MIAEFYSSSLDKCREAEKLFESAVSIRPEKPAFVPVIHGRVTVDGVEKY
ncbi:hypothetical protein [Caproiciproducens sp. CPB-2]|nr:hypothetical protein [Caproiciproducens sp. CPB-2]MDF1494507.1 hypothetical protein [Caproiciproducens sp. CPB-2]